MNEYTKEIAIFIIIFLLSLLMLLIRWGIRRKKRRLAEDMDLMEGHDFEYFCAELLQRSGFGDVEVTRGSGDYGVDILAEKDGVTYAIQSKCYSAPEPL